MTRKEQVTRVIELLEEDDTVIGACQDVGIDDNTFYRYLETDPELKARHKAVPQKRLGRMRRHVYRRASASSDSDKGVRWLERRDDEFKPKIQHQFNQGVMNAFNKELDNIIDGGNKRADAQRAEFGEGVSAE